MRLGQAKLMVAGLVVASAFLIVGAQPRPDLNGTWKMNPDQSRFSGPDGRPKDLVIQFEIQGQTLRETITVVRPVANRLAA